MSKFSLFPRLIPTLALINVYSSAQIYGNDRETDGGDVANFGTSGFYPNAQQDESEVISRPPVVVSSVGRQSATLIFFHGMGDQGDGWAELFRSNFQPNLRHLKFVVPNAREMGGMTAWFEHRGFDDPSADEDREGLNAVTNYAHRGFSQGGPVALYSGLSYPEPLGGILCLSGFLLPKDSLPTQIRQIPGLNMANSAVPIFIGHGLNDPNVPFSVAVSTANALQRFDPNVILRAYQMGHSNCATELDDAIRFIKEKAPSA
uniref:palmitoyl-protein hydrolase n=1 Tax=Globodera rostochiensis TaxID=31243 RepID=A0A914HXB5_GLORO